MNQKHEQSIRHVFVNVDLMVKNIIQINGGKTINVDVSVKTSCMCKILLSESFYM